MGLIYIQNRDSTEPACIAVLRGFIRSNVKTLHLWFIGANQTVNCMDKLMGNSVTRERR